MKIQGYKINDNIPYFSVDNLISSGSVTNGKSIVKFIWQLILKDGIKPEEIMKHLLDLYGECREINGILQQYYNDETSIFVKETPKSDFYAIIDREEKEEEEEKDYLSHNEKQLLLAEQGSFGL